ERGERELVDAQRALQRMPAEALDELRAPEHDPGLRAAEQLVPREADEIGPGRERLPRCRLGLDGSERARAEIVDEGQPVAARHRSDLLEPRPLLEADDAEVGLVAA